VGQSVPNLLNCRYCGLEIDVEIIICISNNQRVWPIARKVSWVSRESEWIAVCIAEMDMEMPICESACITFCGVLVECKKIPNTLSSALHFAFRLCIIILIMVTFFYSQRNINNITSGYKSDKLCTHNRTQSLMLCNILL